MEAVRIYQQVNAVKQNFYWLRALEFMFIWPKE